MTTTDYSTMMGVFDERSKAEQAKEALRAAGFTDDAIFVVERELNSEEAQSIEVERAKLPTEEIPASTETTPASTEAAAPLPLVRPNPSRFIVTVRAPGREQEAVSILNTHGANNSNLPPALERDALSIVSSAEPENVTLPK